MSVLYDCVIVGGGISGLMALDHMVQRNKLVLCLEKGPTCGGMVKHFVEDDVIHNLSSLNNKLIFKDDELHQIPHSYADMFATPLLSWSAKLGLLREFFSGRSSKEELSALDFGYRHFGKEFTDNILNPIVVGKSFGDFNTLDIFSVFPDLKTIEKQYGSFLKYLVSGEGRYLKNDFSGMTKRDIEVYIERIAENYAEKIRLNSKVSEVYRKLNVYVVRSGNGTFFARNLIMATSAPEAAKLLTDVNKELAENLHRIEYGDMNIVTLEYAKDIRPEIKNDFGFLVPENQGMSVVGGVYSRNKLYGRNPVVKMYYRKNTGHKGQCMAVGDLARVAREEISRILKNKDMPVNIKVDHVRDGVPLYNIGHRKVRLMIQQILKDSEDIFLVGNYLDGITVDDAVETTKKMNEQLVGPVPSLVKHDSYLEPFSGAINYRSRRIKEVELQLVGQKSGLAEIANGHLYFGLHRLPDEWVFREWAPNATAVYLVGDFSGWGESEEFRLDRIDENGVWEIRLAGNALSHLDPFKLIVHWHGGKGERIPSYANYVVQDKKTHLFCARVWNPPGKYRFKNTPPVFDSSPPVIYEAHVGMAQIEGKVSSYREFREHTLPRIVKAGYNTVQLMAIQEHPYYGSFGYQVSNFFAPSSGPGTPDDLKELIDEAHGKGLRVIMDIVHSHAVKNENEGLGRFDGTTYQYFHEGGRGLHPAWDTLCFDYLKPQVMHFLLSNCRYWIDEFQFDGFRFDGVTSMLYTHHGLGKAFLSYGDYFNDEVDEGALIYLALANKLLGQMGREIITIAEDMSGLPGLGAPLSSGGIGFDFRLGMGIPDFWIKTLKEKKDENWRMSTIWHELTNFRNDEKVIAYAESHDQALVGDKTIIFHLIDKDMYTNMEVNNRNMIVDRGIALHKMIRLITFSLAKDGYLNFMGNEFGHPEWIDFPREGNNWSFHYARRQWNLADDERLCYKFLANFDREMMGLAKDYDFLSDPNRTLLWEHDDDHVMAFSRAGLFFIFNFDPRRSYADYMIDFPKGAYQDVLNSDRAEFGGYERYREDHVYRTHSDGGGEKLSLYLPVRTALVLKAVNC